MEDNTLIETPREAVKHQQISPDGYLVLYTTGDVEYPDGEVKSINSLVFAEDKDETNEVIHFDNRPGNVFIVKGELFYALGYVEDKGLAYLPRPVVLCVNWKTWTLIWDTSLDEGMGTALAIDGDYLYASSNFISQEKDHSGVWIAKMDLDGNLLWATRERSPASFVSRVTDINPKTDVLELVVVSTSEFFDATTPYKITMTRDGEVLDRKKLLSSD